MKDLKEKARKLILNSSLRDFPVIYELYVLAFDLATDALADETEIVNIVRMSKDPQEAYEKVCYFLDLVEQQK